VDGDGRPDLLGAVLDPPSGGFHLDVWLNATP
jgi:hypothetical protein